MSGRDFPGNMWKAILPAILMMLVVAVRRSIGDDGAVGRRPSAKS